VRCFGVEASDFFVLVEKLHRTVQQDMHIDSLIGIGAIGRMFGDLKECAFKGDGVVLSDSALLFKAQGSFDLGGAGFSPGGLGLGSWLGEFAVMLGERALEHDLCLGWVFRSRSSEFTDQPVLESSPQSLDSAFGLRRTCWDEGYPELLQASAYLG
jgi:hypothetical protein